MLLVSITLTRSNRSAKKITAVMFFRGRQDHALLDSTRSFRELDAGRCQRNVSPDTRFCRLIPTPVLPLNPDTGFAA
jgi:hypothetical protein